MRRLATWWFRRRGGSGRGGFAGHELRGGAALEYNMAAG